MLKINEEVEALDDLHPHDPHGPTGRGIPRLGDYHFSRKASRLMVAEGEASHHDGAYRISGIASMMHRNPEPCTNARSARDFTQVDNTVSEVVN